MAGAGVGKIVLIGELAHHVGPTVVAGLLDRSFDVRDFEGVFRELGVWDGTVVVWGADAQDQAAVAQTALALAESSGGWVLTDERMLANFSAAQPGVPVLGFGPHVHPEALPSSEDVVAQWVLDPARAKNQEFPALAPAHCHSTAPRSPRHRDLDAAVRAAIANGDPVGERLLAWLTQPFWVAEGYNGRRGVRVTLNDTSMTQKRS